MEVKTRNGSQQNSTPAALSPGQVAALEALLAGRTVTEAATVAGVDRTTVHAWLRSDYAFQAAYNRGRRDLQEQTHARLMTLAEKAVGCVEGALAKGDEKTALAVLRGLGLLSGVPAKPGSDDPEILAAAAEGQAVFARMEAELAGPR